MGIKDVVRNIKNKGLGETLSIYRTRKRMDMDLSGFVSEQGWKVKTIDLSQNAGTLNQILDSVTEPFVGFFDPKAKYGKDYFNHLLEGFAIDPAVGSVRGCILTKSGKLLMDEQKSDPEVFIRDAASNFTQAILLPYGAVYRTEIIQKYGIRFPENLKYGRDEAFALRYAEVGGKNCTLYKYRYKTNKILDESTPNSPQASNKRWYFDSTLPLMEQLRNEEGKLSRIAQYGLLYLMIQRFKSNYNTLVKIVFESPEEGEQYLKQAGQVISELEDDVLFCRGRAVRWTRNKRLFLANLPDPEHPFEMEVRTSKDDAMLYRKGAPKDSTDICRLSEQKLQVLSLHYRKNAEGTDGLAMVLRMEQTFPPETFEIWMKNGPQEYQCRRLTVLAGIGEFFDRPGTRKDAYSVFVPLDQEAETQTLSAEMRVGDTHISKPLGFADKWQNKLNTNDPYGYWYFDGHIVQSKEGAIEVRQASEADRDAAEERYLEHLRELRDQADEKERDVYETVIWVREEYRKRKDELSKKRIWTYNDKGFKAGDNADYAIRYAAKQEDGIEKVFYIDQDSPDGKRLAAEGFRVMQPGTPEATLYAVCAEVIYMTHVPPYAKLGLKDTSLPLLKDLMDPKVIRMYHGFPITRAGSYAQVAYDAEGVVVCSEYERELYTNEDNGFLPEQVIPSGMPRYDDLVDDSRRQILFAPSWRPSLAGKTLPSGETLYNPKFKDSAYYKLYDQILNDPKLQKTAEETGYQIRMFLHPKMAAQTVDFGTSGVMTALSCTQDMDYVTIMKQSDLMVTDFSSVQYDFAYMRKPVVYYHDPALPYWRITNFDYESIGFGEICRSASELVDILCDYMRHECSLKEEYRKRIESFFLHDDRLAAKRLYEATCELCK